MSGIHAVSPARHSNYFWKPISNFAFAISDNTVPLTGRELLESCSSLPAAFIKVEGGFSLVGVLGLEDRQNLLVSNTGSWRGRYLPQAYRIQPFTIGEIDNGKTVLSVDENSDLLVKKSELSQDEIGKSVIPFYDSDGKPSAHLLKIKEFFTNYVTEQELTQRILERLSEFDLVKPWRVSVQSTNGDEAIETNNMALRAMDGLYKICEPSLNALEPKDLSQLRDLGALWVAYCQLLSMRHMRALIQLGRERRKEVETKELLIDEIDQTGSINFDNLLD
jgi:hypothetical protein